MLGISGHQPSGHLFVGRNVQNAEQRLVAAPGTTLEKPCPARAHAQSGRHEFGVGKGKMRILLSPREILVAQGNDEVGRTPEDHVFPRFTSCPHYAEKYSPTGEPLWISSSIQSMVALDILPSFILSLITR